VKLADQARDQYQLFINGVTDAIDTGVVSHTAQQALLKCRELLEALGALDPQEKVGPTLALMQVLATDLRRSAAIQSFLPHRQEVNTVNRFITDLVAAAELREHNHIVQVALSAKRKSQLALVMLGLTMLSAAVFLYSLVKGLTEPLYRAVGMAESIAAGDFKQERPLAERRDLGDLMSALEAMRNSLSKAFQDLEKNRIRLANAQLIARIGDWEVHLPEGAIVVSEGIAPIIGQAPDKFSWKRGVPVDIVHPDDRPLLERSIESAHSGGSRFSHDFRIVLPEGELRHVHSQMEVVHDAQGNAVKLTGTLQDITDRKNAEKQVEFLALHDGLTGLPNRLSFNQESAKIFSACEKLNQQAAMLYMDLDRFKNVNDSLGHHNGDALLIEVTQRLGKCLRKSDYLARDLKNIPENLVARLGGDEFTILLANLQHTDDAARVAQRILDELSAPFQLNGQEVFISASIGIALYPLDGIDAPALTQNADAAMYHAKKEGRNNYQFFTASMNMEAASRMLLESDLRRAESQGQLVLHYQPQIDIATQKIYGVEALLRWRHPELGLVSPNEFIPLAEERGLIVQIGEWVLRTACAQARAWQLAGFDKITMAVNLASPSFRQLNLQHVVQSALGESGLTADCLELEMTESTIMQQLDIVLPLLKSIKSLGVHLSLDDFGTGYSSLSYLNKFPLDALKIDRSFVTNFDKPDGKAIITAIIALANSLKLDLIAEGVETKEQADFLLASGCKNMQGFLFSKALPVEEITQLLQQQSCRTATVPA